MELIRFYFIDTGDNRYYIKKSSENVYVEIGMNLFYKIHRTFGLKTRRLEQYPESTGQKVYISE